MAESLIGIVVHQWQKAGAALLALSGGGLSVGDTIRIKGHTTDFMLSACFQAADTDIRAPRRRKGNDPV